jgi:hypothetical protein
MDFSKKTHRCVGGGFGVVIVDSLPARRRETARNARNRGLNRVDGDHGYGHRESDYRAASRFAVNANFRCVRWKNPHPSRRAGDRNLPVSLRAGLQFHRLVPAPAAPWNAHFIGTSN